MKDSGNNDIYGSDIEVPQVSIAIPEGMEPDLENLHLIHQKSESPKKQNGKGPQDSFQESLNPRYQQSIQTQVLPTHESSTAEKQDQLNESNLMQIEDKDQPKADLARIAEPEVVNNCPQTSGQ